MLASTSLLLIVGIAALFLALLVISLWRHKQSGMKPVQLRGAVGLTTTDLKPEGTVLINGEIWTARSFTGTTIPANKPVDVIGFEAHLILVKE